MTSIYIEHMMHVCHKKAIILRWELINFHETFYNCRTKAFAGLGCRAPEVLVILKVARADKSPEFAVQYVAARYE